MNLIQDYQDKMFLNDEKRNRLQHIEHKKLVFPNYIKTCFIVMFDIC